MWESRLLLKVLSSLTCLAISQNLGKVVENEQSTEIHTKTTFYIDDSYMYKIVYFDMQGKERHHKYIH